MPDDVEKHADRSRSWRQAQRVAGVEGRKYALTERAAWVIVPLLVLLINARDTPSDCRVLHSGEIQRRLGWSKGKLHPRLRLLEGLGWISSEMQRKRVADVRYPNGRLLMTVGYSITGAGEAVAVVWSKVLLDKITIIPRARRRV